jgi:LmbE family N-acetylglucosaminyl deacetylase
MNIFNQKRILVIVAHPDDELLGPGGTIHRLSSSSSETQIKVVILGEGITSRGDVRDAAKWDSELKQHQQNIRDAQSKLGYNELAIHTFPDNRFDSVPLLDIIKVVEREKESFKPDLILTHHGGDVNVDHQLTFQAVVTATRPMEHETVQAIVTFETPSGTEWIPSSDPRQFVPNLFIGISEADLQAKIDAMECYKYERRAYPHPRSPEALRVRAQFWGVTVGKPIAEAFQVVRWIEGVE